MSGPRVGDPLSARQTEILHLVAEGYSDAHIGHRLGLHTDAVKSHVRRIRARLGARDRANLVHLAHQRGLFTERPRCTGDRACYRRHQRRGERPCPESIRANTAYARTLRQAAKSQLPTSSSQISSNRSAA